MTYGLGRALEPYRHADGSPYRSCEAAKNDYRFSDLVWGIVNSTQFRMKGGA